MTRVDKTTLAEAHRTCRIFAARMVRNWPRWFDQEMATSIAWEAVERAAETWQPGTAPFGAYAAIFVRGRLQHARRAAFPGGRVCYEATRQESRRRRLAGLPEPEAADLLALGVPDISPIHLLQEGHGLEAVLADAEASSAVDRVTLRVALSQVLARLPARERAVLEARAAGERQEITAARLACSQNHVSRLGRQAAEKVREELAG